MKGFTPLLCQWVQQFVYGGSVVVKVNNDKLAIFITRAKEDGQIEGLIPHLVDGGLSILQYADDTLLFMEHDLEKAKNVKIILCSFEQLSGLKINFHKSELFCYGEAKHHIEQYSQIFGCEIGLFPFRYLGIPMNHKKLNNRYWKVVEDRFLKN